MDADRRALAGIAIALCVPNEVDAVQDHGNDDQGEPEKVQSHQRRQAQEQPSGQVSIQAPPKALCVDLVIDNRISRP